MNHHFSYAYGFFANSFLVALKSAPPATRQEGRMIAVPPSFVFHRISLNTSSPITGTNRKCLHSVSFSISVPKLPSTPRSADIFQPMNVLLYQPPGAYSSLSSLLTIFYHDTCVVFICQDTNTNSAICTFLFPYPQFGLTRITKSAIVNLQTQANENRYVRSVWQIIWCAIIHVHEYPNFYNKILESIETIVC